MSQPSGAPLLLGERLARLRSAMPVAVTSAGAFMVLVAGAGLTYLAQLVVARTVGPDSFGIYAYVLAWITFLAYLSTLGFHVTLLRLVPTYRTRGEWRLARGVLGFSRLLAGLSGLAVAIAGITLISSFGYGEPELSTAFLVGLVAVPLFALQLVTAAAIRAFDGAVLALVPERIVRDTIVIVAMLIAGWVHIGRPDAITAMAATVLAAAGAFAFAHVTMRRLRPSDLSSERPARAVGEWLRPTISLTVIMAADNLMTRSGVLALGLLGNLREAGIFAVAFSMAYLTALPRMAVASVFAPTVATLHARGDHAGLQLLAVRASWLSLIGTIAVAAPLLVLTPMLLGWFGPGFAEGATLVVILVAGQVFAAAAGPQQHLITMTANERSGAIIFAVCALGNFVAALLLIEPFGSTGAAVATAGSVIAWNVAMAVFVRRRLGLAPGLLAPLMSSPRAFPRETDHGT
jgi:O-antigen/teichoic acid export membrane protein